MGRGRHISYSIWHMSGFFNWPWSKLIIWRISSVGDFYLQTHHSLGLQFDARSRTNFRGSKFERRDVSMRNYSLKLFKTLSLGSYIRNRGNFSEVFTTPLWSPCFDSQDRDRFQHNWFNQILSKNKLYFSGFILNLYFMKRDHYSHQFVFSKFDDDIYRIWILLRKIFTI